MRAFDMIPVILSAILLILVVAAFILGVYYSIKKRKRGGCSGCSGCPAANGCDKKKK